MPPSASPTSDARTFSAAASVPRGPSRGSRPGAPTTWTGRRFASRRPPRARALRGEEVVEEFKIERPDGRWVVVRANGAPVRGESGQIQSAVIAFEDVSAQKRS